MAVLWNKTQNKAVLQNLIVADNFYSRAKGLLGTKSLGDQEGMLFYGSSSIHTFFMNYSLDCVFLDKKMNICGFKKNIVPFRITAPVWKAAAVIELRAGVIDLHQLKLGDELHVGA